MRHVDRMVETGHQPPAGQEPLLAVGQGDRRNSPVEVLLGEEARRRVGRFVDVVVTIEQISGQRRQGTSLPRL